MDFRFSRNNLDIRERRLERFFEIIPGAVSWGVLAGMAALSFLHPARAAAIIIAFDLYWILRLFYMNLMLVMSYVRLSIDSDADWVERIRDIDAIRVRGPEQARLSSHPARLCGTDGRQRACPKPGDGVHRRRLARLVNSGSMPPPSEALHHLIIFPVARESREIVEPSVAGLAAGNCPPQRMIVLIALEANAPADVKKSAYAVESAYRGRFLELAVVEHPAGVEGEARVKGANTSHAARYARRWCEEKGIALEHVLVSCFDSDTVAHPDYFNCLTYNFMMTPDRMRASFQPIPVYHNNIWDAPGFARVLDVGSSFFQMIEATNPEKLVTFSSHSMSFKSLVDVGYWPVDMISDDSAIFWKSYLHYDGEYAVVPLYITVSMDVTLAGSWWKTVVNVYKQRRRWAWGVENFPLVMRGFLRSGRISLAKKVSHGFKLFEGHVAWATWPFLLSVIGWLPALFAGREFTHSTMYYSAPRITMTIFHLATIALLICIVLSVLLLPRTKTRFGFLLKAAHALEWLLVPLVSVFLNAVPALDAQTRLMFGRYMEFWVTVKKRKRR